MSTLNIIVLVLMCAILVTIIAGIAMSYNAKNSQKSNKLMALRVILQFSVVILVGVMWVLYKLKS